MSHTPNELSEFFPDQADKIHDLRESNAHFERLATAYHTLNRQVHRGETNVEPMDDFHLEDLRKQRLKLLDEISAMLRGA